MDIGTGTGAITHTGVTDEQYRAFLDEIERNVERTGKRPLFVVGPPEFGETLWQVYLNAFSPAERQHYNCRSCRQFIEKYGALVVINPDGTHEPVVWSETSSLPAARQLFAAVRDAPVRTFVAFDTPEWGRHVTGTWRHMAVHAASIGRVTKTTKRKTLDAVVADVVEAHQMIGRAIADYPTAVAQRAAAMLSTGTLHRSEKASAVADWFAELRVLVDSTKHHHQRRALLWLLAANAPVGFAHVRSTMIGTLLDDLVAGTPTDEVVRRWNDKIRPDKYQRPVAPPKSGAINNAERLVAELGLAPSLVRRFAELRDLERGTIWKPHRAEQSAVPPMSVFGHLRANTTDASPTTLPGITPISFEKFKRVVLLHATRIAFVPNHHELQSFGAFTTAVHADAPPILQWDHHELRTPVAWYVYTGGSLPSRWGIVSARVDVTAIVLGPHQWDNANAHRYANHAPRAMFVLDGAADSRNAGLALFPETLKSELHEIRSVIEAHSRARNLLPSEGPPACGIIVSADRNKPIIVEVTTTSNVVTTYSVDRWD